MGKTIKEFVTYWGPSINDWGDIEKRFVIERDEDQLKRAPRSPILGNRSWVIDIPQTQYAIETSVLCNRTICNLQLL